MPSAVFILLREDGRLLMEYRDQNDTFFPNAWLFPGGKLEPGEEPIDGLMREAREELDISVLDAEQLGTETDLFYARPHEESHRLHPFLVTRWDGEVPDWVLDSGAALAWRTLGEALEAPTENVRLLAEAVRRQTGLRVGDWVHQFLGGRFYPFDPRPDEIDIKNIAHGLSNLCRYNGQVSRFMSVAEHSVLVARAMAALGASPTLVLRALLHDAAEALGLGDMVRPVKKQLVEYRAVEGAIETAIWQRFGIPEGYAECDLVNQLDNLILYDEALALMRVEVEPWHERFAPGLGVEILGLPPLMAEAAFLAEYRRWAEPEPSIIVDDIFVATPEMYHGELKQQATFAGARSGHQWAHLTSRPEGDPDYEHLHAFADRLGLKRTWFQGDHYDVTRGKRQQAINCGAVEVTGMEVSMICHYDRKGRARPSYGMPDRTARGAPHPLQPQLLEVPG